MRALIAIPTYWTRAAGTPPRADDALFDHPTPLDGRSTLPRLLESLAAAEHVFPFDILVVTGVVGPDLLGEADARVEEMLREASDFPLVPLPSVEKGIANRGKGAEDLPPRLFHVGPTAILRLQERMARVGLPRGALSPFTYPGIRNVHLVLPYLLGYDVVIALDDDEIVPPHYFRRVQEALGAVQSEGLAGVYRDTEGSPYLKEAPLRDNIFLDKAHWMNLALHDLMHAGQRWVPTPLAFGGNMIFHRSLMARVGFDPHITRGEDIDYVLNAALAGSRFLLDTELYIVHRPPKPYDIHPYAKLVQDVYRFLYEREKARLAPQQASEWLTPFIESPYPGRFLREDVEHHALEALHALADEEAIARWGSPDEILARARRHARALAATYFTFAKAWEQGMQALTPTSEH